MVQMPKYVSYREKISAAHINSIIDALRKIQPVAGANVSLDQGSFGTRINAQPKSTAAGGSTFYASEDYPFKLRWYSKGDGEDDGEWQIYMPYGCATLTTQFINESYSGGGNTVTYMPVNEDAKDKDGNQIFQWYTIETPSDADAEVGEYMGYAAKQWAVHLWMKPYPRMMASTKKEQPTRMQWDVIVGTLIEVTISGEEGETSKSRRTLTMVKTPIEKTFNSGETFSVIYEMDGDEKRSKYKVYLTNQQRIIGRAQVSVSEDTEITDWKSVWVNIKHDKEKSEMEIKEKMSGSEAISDNDHTTYQIYALKDNIVVNDYRDKIPEMNFYTNGPTAPTSNT